MPNLEQFPSQLPPTETESDNQDSPEYTAEHLEGLDQAASAVTAMIADAVESGRVNHDVVETSEGLRGSVRDTFSGGVMEGLFDGPLLRRVNLNLAADESSTEHTLSIVDPESPHPQVLLDGEPIDADMVPSAQRVIESIKDELAAEQEASITPVEQVVESDDEDLPRAA